MDIVFYVHPGLALVIVAYVVFAVIRGVIDVLP